MGTDAAIFRTMGKQTAMRTDQYNSRWLNGEFRVSLAQVPGGPRSSSPRDETRHTIPASFSQDRDSSHMGRGVGEGVGWVGGWMNG